MELKQADVSTPLRSSGCRTAAPAPRSDPQPRDYVLWSAFNVLLWCALCGLGCLGFPPLVYSIKARDCKALGDLEGARRHGQRARVANIVCSVVVAVALVTSIIITALVMFRFRRL